MMTDSVILVDNNRSIIAGGTGTIITSTLAIMLTGRIKSCQRDNDELMPALGRAPVAIHDSGADRANCAGCSKTTQMRGETVSKSGIDVQPDFVRRFSGSSPAS